MEKIMLTLYIKYLAQALGWEDYVGIIYIKHLT